MAEVHDSRLLRLPEPADLQDVRLSDPGTVQTVRDRIHAALEHLRWPDRTLAREMGSSWAQMSQAQLHALFHPSKAIVKSMPLSFIDAVARALGCKGGYYELLSDGFSNRFLGTVYDGQSDASLKLAKKYSEQESEEKTRHDGKVVVYSWSPAPVLITSKLQEILLNLARPDDDRIRGAGEMVKCLRSVYAERRREFTTNGFGRARFINYVPSDVFFAIIERRGPFCQLKVEDILHFLDFLWDKRLQEHRVLFGLVNEKAVTPEMRVWMMGRDSIMTVGDSLTITARKSDKLPLVLIDSERRSEVEQTRLRLRDLEKSLLFDPDDCSAVRRAFDDFRRRAERSTRSLEVRTTD